MNLSTNTKYRSALAANAARPCNAPGCCHLRVYLEAYCRKHYRPAERHGHPNASGIQRRAWTPYRTALQALWALPANAHHDGLVHWTTWAEGLLKKAALDPSRLSRFSGAAPELIRLAEAGITGRLILESAVAFGVFTVRNGGRFPSLRAQDFAMARAVLQLAPLPRSASGWTKDLRRGALVWLGRTLREELASLVAMTADALEKQAKRDARTREEVEADRRRPLAI